jgi:nitric oxide dioxygenase
MAVKHCGLQVLPQHYSIVEDNLMLTIGEVLGDAVTEEVASGWKEAVQFLSGTLINVEENLYSEAEKRQGGWRGWKQFLVKEHEKIADGTVLVTLAADNLPIDFSPGQFLTIRANDVEAPRHYTIVSSPGEKFLQIAVKQVEGGAMSTFIHNDLKQGSTLEVSPPFGNFVASANKDSVLISGGIGITTMVAFQKSLGDKVKKIIHVDQSSEKHAFLTLQQGVNCDKKFFYSKTDRRPNIESIVNEAIVVGPDTNIYICGPGTFMHDIKNMLNEKGATNVSYEAFGPQLSH